MLSDDEVRYEFNMALGKSAVRSQATSARQGWLYRILPAAILILAITLGGVQMATKIPVQDVFTGARDVDGPNATGNKLLIARVIVFCVMLGLLFWLYQAYTEAGNNVGGMLVGANLASNPVMDVMKVNKMQQLQKAQMSANLLQHQKDEFKRLYEDAAARSAGAPPLIPVAPGQAAAGKEGYGPHAVAVPGLAQAQAAANAAAGGPLGTARLSS